MPVALSFLTTLISSQALTSMILPVNFLDVKVDSMVRFRVEHTTYRHVHWCTLPDFAPFADKKLKAQVTSYLQKHMVGLSGYIIASNLHSYTPALRVPVVYVKGTQDIKLSNLEYHLIERGLGFGLGYGWDMKDFLHLKRQRVGLWGRPRREQVKIYRDTCRDVRRVPVGPRYDAGNSPSVAILFGITR
jgi:hypothetical protein